MYTSKLVPAKFQPTVGTRYFFVDGNDTKIGKSIPTLVCSRIWRGNSIDKSRAAQGNAFPDFATAHKVRKAVEAALVSGQ